MLKKTIYIVLGILCTGLAILGIFLPILPTTPLLLLSSWLFVRSSDKLNQWLLNHKVLGKYIKSYVLYKGISRKSKIIAISMIWVSISICVFIIDRWILRILLIGIAATVTIHLLSLKTLSLKEIDQLDSKLI